MKIYFDDSATGAGKTTRCIDRLVAKPIRAIFCAEQIKTATDIKTAIEREARRAGTFPLCLIVNSESGGMSVTQKIKNILADTANVRHVIVMITHSALLQCDFSQFFGWSLVIDEIPNLIDTATINTSLTMDHYRRSYTLTPINAEWSKVGLTPYGRSLSVSDVARDHNLKATASDKFHARVLASQTGRNTVVARVTDWDALDSREEWFWSNLYSMRDLAAFDDVTILANRALESCQVQMVRAADAKFAARGDKPVIWKRLKASNAKPFTLPRFAKIRFYSEAFLSKTFLESSAGIAALTKIGKDLDKRGSCMIWSANTKSLPILAQHITTATQLRPRQAGSNKFRHFHEAAIVYAGNPSRFVESLLKLLNIDKREWQKSVEHETILQFVTRTSIRDANSSTPVTFTVFDRDDAEYLSEYLQGLGHTVELEFVDLGFTIDRKKAGRRPLSEAERKANRVATRFKSKEKEKAARRATNSLKPLRTRKRSTESAAKNNNPDASAAVFFEAERARMKIKRS